jgi:hypothetical protein
MVCQGSDMAAVKRDVLETHLRVARQLEISGSEAAQTIVTVKGYDGFDLSDRMNCTMLCDLDPNPRVPTIGVVFEKDVRILRARLPDSLSVLRALNFCGRRGSFDFQAQNLLEGITVNHSGGKISLLSPDGSNMDRRNKSARDVARAQTSAIKSSAVTTVGGSRHRRKQRDVACDAASVQNIGAKDLDGSARPEKKRKGDVDCGTENADETANKVGRVSERSVRGGVGFHLD